MGDKEKLNLKGLFNMTLHSPFNIGAMFEAYNTIYYVKYRCIILKYLWFLSVIFLNGFYDPRLFY